MLGFNIGTYYFNYLGVSNFKGKFKLNYLQRTAGKNKSKLTPIYRECHPQHVDSLFFLVNPWPISLFEYH
jgi:hypothetical protein